MAENELYGKEWQEKLFKEMEPDLIRDATRAYSVGNLGARFGGKDKFLANRLLKLRAQIAIDAEDKRAQIQERIRQEQAQVQERIRQEGVSRAEKMREETSAASTKFHEDTQKQFANQLRLRESRDYARKQGVTQARYKIWSERGPEALAEFDKNLPAILGEDQKPDGSLAGAGKELVQGAAGGARNLWDKARGLFGGQPRAQARSSGPDVLVSEQDTSAPGDAQQDDELKRKKRGWLSENDSSPDWQSFVSNGGASGPPMNLLSPERSETFKPPVTFFEPPTQHPYNPDNRKNPDVQRPQGEDSQPENQGRWSGDVNGDSLNEFNKIGRDIEDTARGILDDNVKNNTGVVDTVEKAGDDFVNAIDDFGDDVGDFFDWSPKFPGAQAPAAAQPQPAAASPVRRDALLPAPAGPGGRLSWADQMKKRPMVGLSRAY